MRYPKKCHSTMSQHQYQGRPQNLGHLVGKRHRMRISLLVNRTGGIFIPHKGYIEASVSIPDLPYYNEDALLVVISDSKHGKRVPV